MKKHLKKVIVMVSLSFLLSGIFLLGLGEQAAAATKTVRIWSIFPEDSIRGVKREFQKKHPNIEIEYLQVPWSNAGWAQKIITGLLSADLPDVVYTAQGGAEWSAPVRGAYRSLNRFLDRDNIAHPTEPPPITKMQTLQGQVYSLPINWDYSLVYYNKTMFSEAGLGGPPKTWDDLIEHTTKITKRDASGELQLLGFASSHRTAPQHFAFTMGADGHFFSRDGKTATHDSAASVAAGELMVKLKDIQGGMDAVSKLAPRARGVADPLVREKTAMGYFTAASQLGEIEKHNPGIDFGVTPMPAPAGKTPKLIQSGVGVIMMPTVAENPAEAWEFMKFWYENQLLFAVDYWNTRAVFPATYSIARTREFTALHPSLPEMVDLLDSVSGTGQVLHIFATDINWINMAPAIDNFVRDKGTPKQNLEVARKRIQEELDGLWSRLADRGLEIELKRW